jgi:hypothetical protein
MTTPEKPKNKGGRPKGSTQKYCAADLLRAFKNTGSDYLEIFIQDFLSSAGDTRTRLAYHQMLVKYLFTEIDVPETSAKAASLTYEEMVQAAKLAIAAAETKPKSTDKKSESGG